MHTNRISDTNCTQCKFHSRHKSHMKMRFAFNTVLFHVIETGPSSLSIQFLYMHRPCSNLSIYLSFYNGEETGGFATCAGQGSPSGAISWRFRCRRRSCNVLCVCVQPFSSLFLTSQKIQAKNHEKVLFSCFISW